jgi:DNA polymerase-4
VTTWVLHADMDAFYASVEVREQPQLRGRPVVVGGTGNRGVVASASYEARSFGVRSAMPISQARRLCPQAVFVAPRFALYQRYSEGFHHIALSFTPAVEGIGMDEAFLDVTGAVGLFGPPAQIGASLRSRVADELGLSCCVGAGPSKLVAKLASEAAKPKASARGAVPGPGVVVVAEGEVLAFLWPLPIEALWGVGRASAERLRKLGVSTVGDLAALPAEALVGALGRSAGHTLHSLAWGRDDRPVVADREVKSIGHEETYPTDVADRGALDRRLVLMADQVAARVREGGLVARTVVLKLRYGDFTTLTRSHTFAHPQQTGPALWTAARALLDELPLKEGVRLLGVSVSGLLPAGEAPGQQLQLSLSEQAEVQGAPWPEASVAVDAVRARFGAGALRPATALSSRSSPERGAPTPGRGEPTGRQPPPR